MKNSMEFPQEKNRITIQSSNLIVGKYPDKTTIQRYMHSSVHSSAMSNKQMEYCFLSRSCLTVFAAPWTVACQAPLSMGCLRQEQWEDLIYPWVDPVSPTLAGRVFTTEPPWEPNMECYSSIKKNEIMPFAKIWLDPRIVTPSKVSQKDKNTISLTCGI